ncbi:MAG: ABC transporter permease [Bacilli bacterium]|nr:ABC transporter permease [Bacilli bacterium]MDY4052010.1 ABC transporter permease [Bacilli bacterium]
MENKKVKIEYSSKAERIKKIVAKTYMYLILFLMYLPILVLIIYSFTDSDQLGIWNGFSFNLYIALFKNKPLMNATKNTLIIAVVSAVISTIIGTLGAIGVYYSRRKYKKVVETMTQLPVVNAEIVMALSLALVFKLLNTSYSFLTLLIGHVVLTVAFVYLNVKPKLVQMDQNIYEAALDLGATPMHALWKVVIPEIMPGIFSGFLISITLSLDDFVITQYLKEPSFETISTYIQKIVAKHPIPAEVRALSTILFVIVLSVVVGITIYNNKQAIKKSNMRRGK